MSGRPPAPRHNGLPGDQTAVPRWPAPIPGELEHRYLPATAGQVRRGRGNANASRQRVPCSARKIAPRRPSRTAPPASDLARQVDGQLGSVAVIEQAAKEPPARKRNSRREPRTLVHAVHRHAQPPSSDPAQAAVVQHVLVELRARRGILQAAERRSVIIATSPTPRRGGRRRRTDWSRPGRAGGAYAQDDPIRVHRTAPRPSPGPASRAAAPANFGREQVERRISGSSRSSAPPRSALDDRHREGLAQSRTPAL